MNYYVGNTVVLVPNYNDPNDATANSIIQTLYLTRTVVGIDCRNLYENGGMVHCVTQQQPVAIATGLEEPEQNDQGNVFPNPFNNEAVIQFALPISKGQLIVYNSLGQQVRNQEDISGPRVRIGRDGLQNGVYFFKVETGHQTIRGNFIIAE